MIFYISRKNNLLIGGGICLFKKAIIALLVVIFFLPTLAFNQTTVSAQGFEFRDVSKGTWGYDEIHYLNEKRIQTGYADGTFRPNDSVTRAQAAVIITNALGVGGKKVTRAAFPDVPTNFWASSAIERAAELGIFQGRDDGRFHPNQSITMAQVATVLSRTFKLTGITSSGYSDVSSSFWAVREISALERNGIVERANNFNPNKNASRAQFSTYVARSIEPSYRVSDQGQGSVLYKGTVVNVTSTLNVRSLPGMNGAVVARLPAGSVVEVYGEEGQWLKIKNGSGFAYVHKSYIERVSSSGTSPTPTPPPTSDRKIVAEGKVTASSLNVRKEATASSEAIGRLAAGEIVSIYEYHGKWVLIKFNGQWAYTHIDYLVTKAPGQNGLKGRIIALDPGHGGSDPGAVANGLREKDINLGIAKELEKMLLDKSANPFLTRTNDTFVELSQRAKMANDRNADIFISIHANAATPAANGVETYWDDTYSAAESRALAQHINRHLKNELGMNDRGVKEARFAVIRQSRMPSVLVEVGFITNSGDAAKMKQPDFNTKAARAILKGIEDFYNW